VDTFRAAFVRSPRKSTSHAARQLNMPHITVLKILRERLKLKVLVPTVTAQDEFRYTFCSDFLSRLEDDENFTAKIVFSDEATLRLWETLIDIA
jgi:hypothetical protein